VINYAYAYELLGEEIHKYVGEEPSGMAADEPQFDEAGRPHNPILNAGSIIICSLLLLNNKTIQDVMAFF